MLTAIVALLFAGVVAFDFIPQIKQAGAGNEPSKKPNALCTKKEAAVYLALLLLSFVVLLLYSFHIRAPSPFEAIYRFIEQTLGIK